MSMEIEIFSDRRLASTVDWQKAVEAEGFPLHLVNDVDFHSLRGFLPATLEGRKCGFECFHDDPVEATRALDETGGQWRFALGLRWVGSNFDELQAAWMAATAYATATGGLIFDGEEGRMLTPAEARGVVANMIKDRPRIEAFLKDIEEKFSRKT